ncbi:MAG: DUF397 domain-containing protein [Sciscionella sp.]
MRNYDHTATEHAFAPDAWQRPAFCGPNGGNCVEVNLSDGSLIGLRDSKSANSPVLAFDSQEWSAFLEAVRGGQFDV